MMAPLMRPFPPDTLITWDYDFHVDEALAAWVKRTFIEPGGALHNPRHDHLEKADIAWLWSSQPAKDRNRVLAGEAKIPAPVQSKFGSMLNHYALTRVLGRIPDAMVFLSVDYTVRADDWSFCALIEHELCHFAQAFTGDGEPRFDQETGAPVLELVGHDVEEFVDIVARYGADATGTRALVRAANKGPEIGQAMIDIACGNCKGRKWA